MRTLLVANRGEIARRVLRTASRMELRTVAVYSDADAHAPHVTEADVAVRLGPAAPAESYLDIDAVVAAARATGADAVHPGYGFLSENPALARALEEAGITFVGPSVHALTVMGDKISAKEQVAAHGVPLTAGVTGAGMDDDALVTAAEDLHYPLLVKPSAGGGGKGMTVVETPADLREALAGARRMARRAFGDDALMLEELVAAPRHIEVQVLADLYGNVIHLGERECTLQRRYQKVVEEAPSPLLDEGTRARIGEAACAAARSVGYTGAGTVEFLVPTADPERFTFMEMNTRLQVEHPVTEQVTGLDLVEWQLRIADGERLGLTQEDVTLTGHAVEARVYAEDPAHDFLPTAGTVIALHEPDGEGIRVDSALAGGLAVGSDYDPMLAKVIATAPTRAEALTRLDRALANTVVLGLGTNIEFLRGLVTDPDVIAGDMDTSLIERRLPAMELGRVPEDALLAAAAFATGPRGIAPDPAPGAGRAPGTAWNLRDGWRISGRSPRVVLLELPGGERREVTVPEDAVLTPRGGSRYLLAHPGRTTPLDIAVAPAEPEGTPVWVGLAGAGIRLLVPSAAALTAERLAAAERGGAALAPQVRPPMPGTVVAVPVADGDEVAVGDVLVTIEAMKMEHRLLAPLAGTVSVHVAEGATVRLDEVVAAVAPVEESAADTAAPESTPGPAQPPVPSDPILPGAPGTTRGVK